jgi:HAD superfamily hydrolase (TIGR01509 family)
VTAVRAVVFDLYGTLVHLRDPVFQRGIARRVGAARRDWVDFLRDVLVVRDYPDRAGFVGAVLERFPTDDPETARADATAMLERELASAELEPAARAVLGFLRRRGLKLGLLTNSGSPFREPFDRAGLAELFDAVVFSCELGAKKPAPRAYEAVARALGVAPAETLVIGDSLANDVRTPRELGFRALRVGGSGEGDLASFGDVAWLAGLAEGGPASLLGPGRRLELGGTEGELTRVALLPDDQQGRYNLVATADVAWDDGLLERVYVKRFRHPEAVWMEQFVRPLMGEVGVATNRVAVLSGAEPLLVAREITGERLERQLHPPELAFEIGRHGAAAYVFANSDYQPRNALVGRFGSRASLTILDYEFTLFDRVLEVQDLPERLDPHALERRVEAELEARTRRRVVTPQTVRRFFRSFFGSGGVDAATADAFRAGWREVHGAANAAAGRLEEMVRERIGREPWLVVGTEAYRRALLPVDARDLAARAGTDPDLACDQCF